MYLQTDSPEGTGRAPFLDRARHKAWAVLSLCRVSNLPTVWMNVLAAALLTGVALEFAEILLLAFASSAFYTFGMCLNDLFDRESDAIHQSVA